MENEIAQAILELQKEVDFYGMILTLAVAGICAWLAVIAYILDR